MHGLQAPALAFLALDERPKFSGPAKDFHAFRMYDVSVDGCDGHVVEPDQPLPGRHWVWRTMFWDAFPGADIAFLKAGFYFVYIEVGNTFGCPDAMKHFDVFYDFMTKEHDLSRKVVLEGLSRGGLYAYRWAYVNSDKVCCIYGDAPVCDMKSWPGGKGKGKGSPRDWQAAIEAYHFADEQEMMNFKGNPIDILAPIAAAHIPIIHVCGDRDSVVPKEENTGTRTIYGARWRLCTHREAGLRSSSARTDRSVSCD
jgi:hypothetical protein